ncbi:MAG: hypothetical protein NUK62_02135 [Tenericutes bacterium]|jgi:hypothetical protein|nr:hypothetical protein [Mycoplasmatota bacterium]
MEITWFNEKPKDCVVTLAAGNITLNKPATTFFENAYSVMLGLEKNKQLLIIKPLSKEDAMRHDIPDKNKYRITVRSSYSRVTNKAFMEEISKMYDIRLDDETHKYKATWEYRDQILVVDLKEEI